MGGSSRRQLMRTLIVLILLLPLAACKIRRDTLMQDPATGQQRICYADPVVSGISEHDVCVRNLTLKGWVVVKNSLAF